jgi:hypothetical protein
MPRPSQIRCCLLPRLARSVGFGPVWGPQKPPARNNYQEQRVTSRFGPHAKASSTTQNGLTPKLRLAANRANAASTEPQPSFFGNIHHGIPPLSTKMMPARQARSDSRGRPPCGFGCGAGRSDSIRLQSVSGTSRAAMKRPPDLRNVPKAWTVRGEVLLQQRTGPSGRGHWRQKLGKTGLLIPVVSQVLGERLRRFRERSRARPMTTRRPSQQRLRQSHRLSYSPSSYNSPLGATGSD